MVGVGGRSRGCKTCKKRRIKCDEAKPTCNRCQKAGKNCEGYTQYIEFHDETNRIAKKVYSVAKSDVPAFSRNPGTQRENASPIFITEHPFLPLKINSALDENDVFTKYLLENLFTWRKVTTRHTERWILPASVQSEDDGPLVYTALRALAASFFAKLNRQAYIMQKGAAFYSRALRLLQSHLLNPELAVGDDVLFAVFCLSIYELFVFTHSMAWVNHYKGLSILVALRGPYRHRTGLGFVLLPRLRSTIAISHILQRKRCFLEAPEWKTIPWLENKHSTNTFKHLFDQLSDCGGIIEDSDLFRAWSPDVPGKEQFRLTLARRVHLALEELFAWRWEWAKQFPDATYLVSISSLDPQEVSFLPSLCPFKTAIWFHNDHRATEMLMYNTCRLILQRALDELGEEMITPIPTPNPSDPLLPGQGNRHDIAVESCRMSIFHLQRSRLSMGAFMLIFPLNSAMWHLDGDRGGVKSWLLGILGAMADMHGFEVGTRGYIYTIHQIKYQAIDAKRI
ncbi:hypothetical protein N7456_000578 [Penicillium angulare]|uniref:Zn(2)-C6 fungal-type domain-containing protein n=1 Tax=Penicillium angulare TaxID=116970 RepID=A0A9W9GDA9_9EURO|nr:hypothetical protein N7456_000578 [Penicillium angulare]